MAYLLFPEPVINTLRILHRSSCISVLSYLTKHQQVGSLLITQMQFSSEGCRPEQAPLGMFFDEDLPCWQMPSSCYTVTWQKEQGSFSWSISYGTDSTYDLSEPAHLPKTTPPETPHPRACVWGCTHIDHARLKLIILTVLQKEGQAVFTLGSQLPG